MSADATHDAVMMLGANLHEAIVKTVNAHPDPVLVYRVLPSTLAGLCGSHLLNMARTKVLGDGELDKAVADCCAALRKHADEGANPPPRTKPQDMRHLRDHMKRTER